MVQGIWPVVGCVDEKYNPIYQTACTENKARLEGQSHVSNHSHKCKFKVFSSLSHALKLCISVLDFLISFPYPWLLTWVMYFMVIPFHGLPFHVLDFQSQVDMGLFTWSILARFFLFYCFLLPSFIWTCLLVPISSLHSPHLIFLSTSHTLLHMNSSMNPHHTREISK